MLYETYIDSDGQELIVEILSSGTKYYHNSKNQYHRLDGPAIELQNGGYYCFKKGVPHKIGGPAQYHFYSNVYKWFLNGKEVNIYYICG